MKSALTILLATLSLWFLAGCAAPTSSLNSAGPASITPNISLDSIQVETISSLPDLEHEKRILSDAIISGLNETGLFSDVGTPTTNTNSATPAIIKADITRIKKVSDNARTWVGTWAGQAEIHVHITVSQAGHQIETFEAEAKSGKSAWAGTTDEAVRLAAGQIVHEITRINSQTAQ